MTARQQELPAELLPKQTCQGSWCRREVIQPATGRRRLYCSDECRKASHQQKRTAALQAERARQEEEHREQERRECLAFGAQLADTIARNPAAAAEEIGLLLHEDGTHSALWWHLGKLQRRLG